MRRSIVNMVSNLIVIIMIVTFSGCSQKAGTIDVISTNNLEADANKNNGTQNFQVINEKDIVFQEDFVIPDYNTLYTDGISVISEATGVFAGSNTNWFTIENNGIVYFYYQFLDEYSKPLTEPTYLNYAIVGEQYTLLCGIHVGMTEEEVYALLPDCINCKPDDTDGMVVKGVLTWNVNSFPEGWCESYCEIIMANIEHSGDLPWYLGIMIDKNGIVKAITTCYPTAG